MEAYRQARRPEGLPLHGRGGPDPVTVLRAVGTQRACMSFGGGKFVAGKKYLATGDPPPAACP